MKNTKELNEIAKEVLPKLLILKIKVLSLKDSLDKDFLVSLGPVNHGRNWFGDNEHIIDCWIECVDEAKNGYYENVDKEWFVAVMNSANALNKYLISM